MIRVIIELDLSNNNDKQSVLDLLKLILKEVDIENEPKGFKVGDKVKLKESKIRWYLDDAHGCYLSPLGELNRQQKKDYDNMVLTMMSLAIDPDINGTIIKHHHPNTEVENFKIEILGNTFNIEPQYLEMA